MKIEIIEFYPIKIKEPEIISGTIKIKLTEIGLYMQGIYVSKFKNKWSINLPGQIGFDPIEKKKCRFTYLFFEDQITQKTLIKSLREIVPSFIEKRISDKSKPLTFQPSRLKVKKTFEKKPFTPTQPGSILNTKFQDPPKPSFKRSIPSRAI